MPVVRTRKLKAMLSVSTRASPTRRGCFKLAEKGEGAQTPLGASYIHPNASRSKPEAEISGIARRWSRSTREWRSRIEALPEKGCWMVDHTARVVREDLITYLRKVRRCLTTKELSLLLRKHPETIYRMVDAGFPAIRDGQRWKFDSLQVAHWLEQRSTRTYPAPTNVRCS